NNSRVLPQALQKASSPKLKNLSPLDSNVSDQMLNKAKNDGITKKKYQSLKTQKRDLKHHLYSEKNELSSISNLFLGLFDISVKTRQAEYEKDLENYNSLKQDFQSLVQSNPSLQEAKRVSYVFRQINSGDMDVSDRFADEFQQIKDKYGLIGNFSAMLLNPEDKDEILGNLVDGLEQLRKSEHLQERNITWLHGTRSPALGVMLAMDKTLYPTGMLLKKNIIPLTGELGQGIIPDTGVNNTKLSGTSVSQTGVKTTLDYATSFKPDVNREWNYLSKDSIGRKLKYAMQEISKNPDHLNTFDGQGTKFDFLRAELYIGRMKVVDPDFDVKVSQLSQHLDELKQDLKGKNSPSVIIDFIESLEEACSTPPFIEPTHALRELVNDSFPIIFGSTSVKGNILEGTDLDEHLVKGKVPLKKMHIAFTEEDKMEQLNVIIENSKLNIEVMSFNALKILGGK
ncbi:MAG: hypothetical protein LW832_04870, partial [Parachlamydia sp.]|nr:hypothetical protein [Parachlamydia sp.]